MVCGVYSRVCFFLLVGFVWNYRIEQEETDHVLAVPSELGSPAAAPNSLIQGSSLGLAKIKWNPVKKLKNKVNKAKNKLMNMADGLKDKFKDKWSDFKASASEAVSKVMGYGAELKQSLKDLSSELKAQFGSAKAVMEEKLRAIYAGLHYFTAEIQERARAAVDSAKATLVGFKDQMAEWAEMTKDALEAVKDAIYSRTKQLASDFDELVQPLVAKISEKAPELRSGILTVAVSLAQEVVAWLVEGVLFKDLTQCVENQCTVQDSLMLGQVVASILEPIADWDFTQEGAGDALEAEMLLVVACGGYGNITSFDSAFGIDAFSAAAQTAEEFSKLQEQFSKLDECIMSKCADHAQSWTQLVEGKPAHCNELEENPARHHAGKYSVRYKKDQVNWNVWSNHDYAYDCDGKLRTTNPQGVEVVVEELQWLDVEEVCSSSRFDPALDFTYYYRRPGSDGFYGGLRCLYFVDETTAEGQFLLDNGDLWGVQYRLDTATSCPEVELVE